MPWHSTLEICTAKLLSVRNGAEITEQSARYGFRVG